MKRIFLILIGIVIFLGILFPILIKKLNNNTSQDVINANPEDSTEYVGESTTIIHKDFKALIEKSWQEIEDSSPTYSTLTYYPKNTNLENKNVEIISILITFLGEEYEYTLQDLLDQGVENSKKIIFDFELVESTDWENKNLVGKKIKFTGTQDGIKRNNTQVFGIKYNNLYVITYSCAIDNCNSYPVYNSLTESFEPRIAEQV